MQLDKIRWGSGVMSPEAFAVTYKVARDPRLSFAALGLYVRCLWMFDVCGPDWDVEWFINEFGLPPEETRAGLTSLVDLGFLHTPETDQAEREATYGSLKAAPATTANG